MFRNLMRIETLISALLLSKPIQTIDEKPISAFTVQVEDIKSMQLQEEQLEISLIEFDAKTFASMRMYLEFAYLLGLDSMLHIMQGAVLVAAVSGLVQFPV